MQFDAGVAALSSWDPRVIWISYNFRAGIQRRAREDTEVESEDPRFYQLETKTSVRTETRLSRLLQTTGGDGSLVCR